MSYWLCGYVLTRDTLFPCPSYSSLVYFVRSYVQIYWFLSWNSCFWDVLSATRRQIVMSEIRRFYGVYRGVGRESILWAAVFSIFWIKLRPKLENMHFRNNSYKFLICNYTTLHWWNSVVETFPNPFYLQNFRVCRWNNIEFDLKIAR